MKWLRPRPVRTVHQFVRCLAAPLLLCAFALAAPARAETATVAVATNFHGVAQALIGLFEVRHPHHIRLVSGSTGKLYAQIVNGAPFDVFLAADQARPARLVADARASGQFTYAVGQLVLWSADPHRIDAHGPAVLDNQRFRHLALANPELAPYGQAATEVLQNLGLLESVRSRLVTGENIGQTYAMIASGAAELGFVARSSLTDHGESRPGSHWPVPQHLHAPIRQDSVLLRGGESNPAARAFIRFLSGAESRALIEQAGYDNAS